MNLYAIGLGDMKVNSYLDQPFQAQIKLIDVGNIPLSGIKANIASVEDYERMGLDRLNAVGTLNFVVEKDTHGQPVLKVFSLERISEPYMQVLVDLAWAEGQVYHSYTVLLDPPNYQLVSNKKLLGRIGPKHSKKPVNDWSEREENLASIRQLDHILYGPTTQGETIWQIAQRFKAEQTMLQQMILAIVGANPDAFSEGNLNGLKPGFRLQIPSSSVVAYVPAHLAESEVLAHDKAWQTRQAIEHVIMPPYTQTTETSGLTKQTTMQEGLLSNLPAVPVFLNTSKREGTSIHESVPTTSLVPIGGAFGIRSQSMEKKSTSSLPSKPINIKAEIDIAAAAIDSVHQANSLLMEQMHTLLIENKRLQKQLSQKDHELQKLRKNMLHIMERRGLAGQVHHLPVHKDQNNLGSLFLILLVLLGGGGLVYWMFKIRSRAFLKEELSEDVSDTKNESHETMSDIHEVHEDLSHKISADPLEETPPMIIEPVVMEQSMIEEDHTPFQVDENSPLEPPIIEEITPEKPLVEDKPVETTKKSKSSRKTKTNKKPKETPSDDHMLEFESNLTFSSNQNDEKEPLEDLSIEIKPGKKDKSSRDENTIEFVMNPEEDAVPEAQSQPAKSSIALDTLLDLARTYIGMDDIESAKQSLQEVFEFGNERQKKESKALLDQLKGK